MVAADAGCCAAPFQLVPVRRQQDGSEGIQTICGAWCQVSAVRLIWEVAIMAAMREADGGTGLAAGGDGLVAWAVRSGRPRTGRPVRGGLRFAFYGRVSTED